MWAWIGLDLTKSYKENMKIKKEYEDSFNKKETIPQEPKIDQNQKILDLLNNSKEAKLPVQPLPPQPEATAVASAPALTYNQLPETEKYKTVFPNG